jgi:hypothetical protein
VYQDISFSGATFRPSYSWFSPSHSFVYSWFRTKERISFSMPNQQLPSRKTIKQSCLASLMKSLVTFSGSVRTEWTSKGKIRMSTSWLLAMLMRGMVISLPCFQCFNPQVCGLIYVLIFICVRTSVCFLLTRGFKFLYPNGKWVKCFYSWCWHGRSEVNIEEDSATEERAGYPYYMQEPC